MSLKQKMATIKGIVDSEDVEIMPKTVGTQVYLDDGTILSAKLAAMIAALNLKATTDTLNKTIEDLRTELKKYSDDKDAALINGAPETLDTLKEIADALAENDEIIAAINAAIGLKAAAADLTAHTGNTSNPHKVTATQLGLGKVNNTADADKSVKYAGQAKNDADGNDISATYAKKTVVDTHMTDMENPHGVTAAQLGLGNVNNTADAEKSVKYATQAKEDAKGNDISSVYAKKTEVPSLAGGSSIYVTTERPENLKTNDLWFHITESN